MQSEKQWIVIVATRLSKSCITLSLLFPSRCSSARKLGCHFWHTGIITWLGPVTYRTGYQAFQRHKLLSYQYQSTWPSATHLNFSHDFSRRYHGILVFSKLRLLLHWGIMPIWTFLMDFSNFGHFLFRYMIVLLILIADAWKITQKSANMNTWNVLVGVLHLQRV